MAGLPDQRRMKNFKIKRIELQLCTHIGYYAQIRPVFPNDCKHRPSRPAFGVARILRGLAKPVKIGVEAKFGPIGIASKYNYAR